ncbi:hypothetical protein [Secundilactobacillus collinoides]|uniref:hypothetical protein n=1 Tax=Secundilactobacillus collinoides TaxID=33960 RepID=UPI000A560C65
MEFKWQVKTAGLSAKRFLARQGVSHRMFTQINHSNGKILVNGKVVAPATKLAVNAELTLIMPAEPADPNVPVSHEPLTVIFEDENFLVVAKPAGLTVVPGPSNRTDTLVNRVKGHLVDSQETNLVAPCYHEAGLGHQRPCPVSEAPVSQFVDEPGVSGPHTGETILGIGWRTAAR